MANITGINRREDLIWSIASSCPLAGDGADLRIMPDLCSEALMPLLGEAAPDSFADWNAYCCAFLLDDYYPGRAKVPLKEERREAVLFYLDTLNALFDRERAELEPCRTRDLVLLEESEYTGYDTTAEYEKLLQCLHGRYLYAFMRLHRVVTPFETLGHIAGVNYVSVYIARQLLHTDVRIDPALSSGAAILHDIGKYGCRPEESRRVPYLHYYYTYQFAQQFGFDTIGSIASAHSVWDLELENLSVESLILIYADFRVKSVRLEDGTEQVCFWSLKESYDIILSKLDNVDDAKRRRYAKVYDKLKDFEDYLISLGVSVDLEDGWHRPEAHTPFSLMSTEEMVQAFKYLAISQNLKVMYTTGHDVSFISLLEDIRGEKDWRHVRAFLTVIEEYSGYLKQEQKLVILDFLYEMLSHQDGDIRRQAARISAVVMAGFDIAFKKELPEDVEAPQIGRRMSDVWRGFLHRML
ncbi:MAG: HD domain-containing protein, partial [Lachnospiraceae bacterium]|nr:HD domain-containing protein [Lachnospiraceae bacterium]